MIPSKSKAAVISLDLRLFYETLSVYPNLHYLEYNHNDSRNMKGIQLHELYYLTSTTLEI